MMKIISLLIFTFSNCLAQISIIGSLTHEYNVNPSGQFEDIIEIRNSSQMPVSVKAYQTDYFYTCEGKTYYTQPAGQRERSNANWITLNNSFQDIPPQSTLAIIMKIQVPDSLKLSGTYWSVIMIEPNPSDDTSDDNQPVNQVVRYAVQIVTHVGNNRNRSIRIMDTRLKKTDQFYQFQMDLENDGSLLTKPKMSLELFTSTGQKQAFFEGVAPRLFPGTSIRFHFNLVDIPTGEYQSLLLLDCGEDALFGAKYQLKIGQ